MRIFRRLLPITLLLPFIAAGHAPRFDDAARLASQASCDALPPPMSERAQINDNRTPAGTLRDGVLTLRLEIRAVSWYPEGDDGCAIPVFAFAEEGKVPLIPGPLVRVPAGTIVNVSVRNRVDRTLWLDGFHMEGRFRPRVELAPGSVTEVHFTAEVAGTYGYIGSNRSGLRGSNPATPGGNLSESGQVGQLAGALIVDRPDAPPSPADRVFVLTRWSIPDTVSPPRSAAGLYEILTVNGKSWPYTERLAYAIGDNVRWRVINATDRPHPMHLHGFYFRVESSGNIFGDSALTGERARVVVTERLGPHQTMMLSWRPDRPGNWLFHCHFVQHMSAAQRTDRMLIAAPSAEHHAAGNHALEDMAGLIVGVQVRPRAGAGAAGSEASPRRRLRLFANERPNVFGEVPGFSFVLQEGERAPARDSMRVPGTTIVLRRGEPTQITVFNRMSTPLSVHWHGLELESFYDGVGGWSGYGERVAPTIASGDSFVVRLTPPRAGTFMYHVHGETGDELAQGLYGPLIVLEGSAVLDPETDRIILLSDRGQWSGPLLVNGTESPTMELTKGRTYRLRFINIKSERALNGNLSSGSDTLQWRALARDGAELPRASTKLEPALFDGFGPGQILDYEFTPAMAGQLELRFRTGIFPRTAAGAPTATLTIRVKDGT